jgi:hypothetical protein
MRKNSPIYQWLLDQQGYFFSVLGGALLGSSIKRLFDLLASASESPFWLIPVLEGVATVFIGLAGWFFALNAKNKDDARELYKFRLENLQKGKEPSQKTPEQIKDECEKLLCRNLLRNFNISLTFIILAFALLILKPYFPDQYQQTLLREFKCEPAQVQIGQSCKLIWHVDGASQVFLDNQEVPPQGEKIIRPGKENVYQLFAIGKPEIQKKITIPIDEITIQPTP